MPVFVVPSVAGLRSLSAAMQPARQQAARAYISVHHGAACSQPSRMQGKHEVSLSDDFDGTYHDAVPELGRSAPPTAA